MPDVLVIGGGLAGLRCALEVDPQLSVLVVTKDQWRESNSNYAQGGIAGVISPEDSFDSHIDDTLVAGGDLCDRVVVQDVVRAAPRRIEELIDWGTNFDRADGELLLGREGGHEHNRILHAMGDATGAEDHAQLSSPRLGVPNICRCGSTPSRSICWCTKVSAVAR